MALTKRKFGNVQFNLSAPDAQKVLEIPVDIADMAAKGRDIMPHVTVLWGFHAEVTADQISAITKGIGNIDVVVERIEAFPEGEDGVPLVLRVESEKLRKLRADLEALPHTKTWPDYKPHICIAYLKPGTAEPYVTAGTELVGDTFTLSHLVHSNVDYTVTDLEKLMSPSARLLRIASKFTKEEVDYTPFASMMNEMCERCSHFIQTQGCELVYGEIAATGWCKKWKEKGNALF